jgi:hypothetical protein
MVIQLAVPLVFLTPVSGQAEPAFTLVVPFTPFCGRLSYGAFTLDVKSVLNKNLGGHPRWQPMLNRCD